MMRTLSVVLAGAMISSAAAAAVPARIGLSARLTTADGAAIEGPKRVRFVLYDDAEAGVSLFEEQVSAQLLNGEFYVELGGTKTLDLDLFDGTSDLFIGVAIEGDVELRPRFRVVTTPYAAVARRALKARDSNTLEGLGADRFRKVSEPIPYSDIHGVPPFLESVPSYSAGTGLSLDSTFRFHADLTQLQSRISGRCDPGSTLQEIREDGTVVCVSNQGLSGSGSIEVEADAIEVDIDACPPGHAVSVVYRDGRVDCESIPQYRGLGPIEVVGQTIGFQTAQCPAGQALTGIGADGAVHCTEVPPQDCPAQTARLGMYCIDATRRGPANFQEATQDCFDQRASLCTGAVLLACDQLVRGRVDSDCGNYLDDLTPDGEPEIGLQWYWTGEAQGDHVVDIPTYQHLVALGPQGNDYADEMDQSRANEQNYYWCCSMAAGR